MKDIVGEEIEVANQEATHESLAKSKTNRRLKETRIQTIAIQD